MQLLSFTFSIFQSLSTSAVQGVIIGLCLALPLLILTTLNVVIGFLATVVIGLVTACVIGIIPLAGWKLGVRTALHHVIDMKRGW